MPERDSSFKEGLIQSLIAETRDVSVALASFNGELRTLRDTVVQLSKIIKDGNGQASLLTRFSLIEHTVVGLTNKTNEIAESVSKISQDDRTDKRERSKNKWTFYGTIVPSILALAGSIVALVIN